MHQRTHSKIKVAKKTSKGRNVVHFVNKTPKIAKCAMCRRVLLGVPQHTKKLAKSQKSISRPYGGYICSKCYNQLIKEEIRAKA